MDTLLNPHTGLIIWTVASFLILVVLLRLVAWNPLLGALEEREVRLREEREGAEKARQEAEKIQKDLEERLANAQTEVKDILARANQDGETLRSKLKKTAEEESAAMVEKTRGQLEEEKQRLVGELRKEVATLSVTAAERMVRKSVDKGVQDDVLGRFFKELDSKGAGN